MISLSIEYSHFMTLFIGVTQLLVAQIIYTKVTN